MPTQKTKKYLTPSSYDMAIKDVIEKIQQSKFQPEIILGVSRGGLMPAVYASHLLGKIPVYSIRVSEREWEEFHIQKIVEKQLKTIKKVLVVDDICDSGTVVLLLKKYFEENYPDLDVRFATVHTKKKCLGIIDYYSEVTDGKWIVFPYEKD